MRIVSGRHRGRLLQAPEGQTTRPTSDRLRQSLFDMLWHAPWAGRDRLTGIHVLDAFAGTGALGLEALSRGAGHASFMETDRGALRALRANIAACREEGASTVLAVDATRPPSAPKPCGLVMLDPPYGKGLAAAAIAALGQAGWIAPGAILCAETGRGEACPFPDNYDRVTEPRTHGAGTMHVVIAMA